MRTASKILAGTATLGIAGALLVHLAVPGNDAAAPAIAVVDGAAPATHPTDAIRFVRSAAPVALPAARPPVPKPLAVAAAKKGGADAQMADLSESQPADPRGPAIEQQVAVAFRQNASFPGSEEPTVACTITMCRITGSAAGDPDAVRDALRDGKLLQAYGELGFSAGPDVETAEAGRTAFMVFLNREM